MFLDSLHAKGAVQEVLRSQYKQRWCAPSLITVRLAGRSIRFLSDAMWSRLTSKACKNLVWLSRGVPARVHLANLRLHFNGWHTSARYQQRAGSTCLFCSQEGSEDSLEHILVCPFIHSLLPHNLKKGAPPRLPIKHFSFSVLTANVASRWLFSFSPCTLCTMSCATALISQS